VYYPTLKHSKIFFSDSYDPNSIIKCTCYHNFKDRHKDLCSKLLSYKFPFIKHICPLKPTFHTLSKHGTNSIFPLPFFLPFMKKEEKICSRLFRVLLYKLVWVYACCFESVCVSGGACAISMTSCHCFCATSLFFHPSPDPFLLAPF